MKYEFQSLHRNADIAGKVYFHNYVFQTEDEKLAAFVRRNCKANPLNYWEVTKDMVQTPEAKVVAEKIEKVGKVNRGFRSSDVAQGEPI